MSVFPDAVVVAKAIVDFIKRPSELDLAVKAKARNGIAWADLIAALPVASDIAAKLSIAAHAR